MKDEELIKKRIEYLNHPENFIQFEDDRTDFNPESNIVSNEIKETVKSMIEKLPDEQRIIVNCCGNDGCDRWNYRWCIVISTKK